MWVTFDLAEYVYVNRIELVIDQNPAGPTKHKILVCILIFYLMTCVKIKNREVSMVLTTCSASSTTIQLQITSSLALMLLLYAHSHVK